MLYTEKWQVDIKLKGSQLQLLEPLFSQKKMLLKLPEEIILNKLLEKILDSLFYQD